MRIWISALCLLLASCGAGELQGQDLPDLPPTDGAGMEKILADLDRPAVVNVWASWCLPCRAEAPLLRAAEQEFGDEVAFIGVDVQDTQASAKDFIVTYGIEGMSHYFDRSRSVPQHFGGLGTPVTFFFDVDGTLVSRHNGVIDDRALALGIDEIVGD